MNNRIRVVLADDHPVYRAGLRVILDSEDGIEVVGEAGDGVSALDLVRKLKPDILLLDVTMPEQDGIETARLCYEERISCKIIFLTMHQEKALLNAALRYEVRGYVLKERVSDEIAEAIHVVANGSEYLSSPLAGIMMDQARSRLRMEEDEIGLALLTKAEIRVLRLVASDKTSKEIAHDLGLSIRTIENHRNRMAKKLDLSGVHSLVKFAFSHKEEIHSTIQ